METKDLETFLNVIEGDLSSSRINFTAADNKSFATSSLDLLEKENIFKNILTKETEKSPFEFETFRYFLKEEFKKNLYEIADDKFTDSKPVEDKRISLSEGSFIIGWKLVQTESARLTEFDEEKVVLECLIDKEEKIYEEKEFKATYFQGYTLQIGKLFKLCFYERPNQVMMEVKDNPNLISENDFPKNQFQEKYSGMTIKKRK